MKRLHLHVAVDDLSRSIGFYSTLFAAEPVVVKDDYAKWMLEDPRVNFAISARGTNPGVDHLGIQVESDDDLRELANRLKAAGEITRDQEAANCCYAQSNKSWVNDPSGLRWETFFTFGQATQYGEDDVPAIEQPKAACCPTSSNAKACCWEDAVRAQTPDRPYHVLFLCTGNSARSILGESILQKIGKWKFTAYSAGSDPRGTVNPHAIDLLNCLGYPTGGLRSKSWSEFSGPEAPELDFVFTVCDNAANEVCPFWPGQPMTAHWGVPDPAVEGSELEVSRAFRDAFQTLLRRIELFANLPVASLDRMSLQKRVDEIGKAVSERQPV